MAEAGMMPAIHGVNICICPVVDDGFAIKIHTRTLGQNRIISARRRQDGKVRNRHDNPDRDRGCIHSAAGGGGQARQRTLCLQYAKITYMLSPFPVCFLLPAIHHMVNVFNNGLIINMNRTFYSFVIER